MTFNPYKLSAEEANQIANMSKNGALELTKDELIALQEIIIMKLSSQLR